MDVECSLEFAFSPALAKWTTRASLRLDAKLFSHDRERSAAASALTGDRQVPTDTRETQLRALLYMSKHHRLTEVFIEEEEEEENNEEDADDTDRSSNPCRNSHENGGSVSVGGSELTGRARNGSNGGEHLPRTRRIRTSAASYSCHAYSGVVRHAEPPMTSRSLGVAPAPEMPPRGSANVDGMSGAGGTGNPRNPDETPPTMFSTVMSAIPSSVGGVGDEDDVEEEEDGDRLVLQFDSVSSVSSNVEEPEVCDAVDANVQPSHLPPPRPPPAGIVDSTAAVPPSLPSPPAPPAPPPRRRLLLLRPGSVKDSAAVPPAVAEIVTPPPPPPAQRQRRLVLNVNAAVQPPAEVPPPSAAPTKKPSAPDIVATAASPRTVKAEISGGTTPQRNAWSPHVLSIPYATAVPRRRLVAVWCTFDAAEETTAADAFGEGASRNSQEKDGKRQNGCWSRAQVTFCGGFATAITAAETTRRTDHHYDGYALIMGDGFLHTCWMCPFVASLSSSSADTPSSGSGGTFVADVDELSVLRAGLLQDPWVTSVSAIATVAMSSSSCGLRSTTSVKPEEIVKREESLDDAHTSAAEKYRSEQESASLVPVCRRLPCLLFTPAHLSQLSCAFGWRESFPVEVQADSEAPAHSSSGCVALLSGIGGASRVQWPSLCTSGLIWSATQCTQDCVTLRTVHTSAASAAQESALCEKLPAAVCVCLQTDPHLCDALYAYFLQLQRRWTTEVTSESGQDYSRMAGREDFCYKSSSLRFVFARVAPASLSLRGGAVGTAEEMVFAEETIRAAKLDNAVRADSVSASCSVTAAVLRARVAVTAAMVQHLLWRKQKTFSFAACNSPTDKRRNVSEGGCIGGTSTFWSKGIESNAARFNDVARAVAMQWVCDGASERSSDEGSVQEFLREERKLLVATAAVGGLLKTHNGDGPLTLPTGEKGSSYWTPSTMLEAYQRHYTSSLSAGLSWLARTSAEQDAMREYRVVPRSLVEKQQRLCREALCQSRAMASGRVPGERGVGADRKCVALLTRNAMPLKGDVKVRIQHAAPLNALQVDVDWTTTLPILEKSVGSDNHGGPFDRRIELPFFLLVFVFEVGSQTHHRTTEEEAASDTEEIHALSSRMPAVRLYQATPFSCYVPVQDCTEAGATVHSSVTVVHALDLTARSPSAFEDFNAQSVTKQRSGGDAPSSVAEETKKRSRGRRGKTKTTAKTSSAPAAAARQRRKRGRSDTATAGRHTTQKRRRRRAKHGEDEDEDTDSDSASSSNIDVSKEDSDRESNYGDKDSGNSEVNASDAEDFDGAENFFGDHGDDEDNATLFLDLGTRKGQRTKAVAASARSTHQRGRARAQQAASLQPLNATRALPLVVLRRDCMSPLVDVQVNYAELLADQLTAAGYSADPSDGGGDHSNSDSDEEDREQSTTRALLGLLSHLAGIATVQAAMPHAVAELRQQHERARTLSLFSQTGFASRRALVDPSVLHAYKEVLLGVLPALACPADIAKSPRVLADAQAVLGELVNARSVASSAKLAINEFARVDQWCRACVLRCELDEELDLVTTEAAAAGGLNRKKKPPKSKEHQSRLKEGQDVIAQVVQLNWRISGDEGAVLLSAFCEKVLGSLPAQARATVRQLGRANEDAKVIQPIMSPNNSFGKGCALLSSQAFQSSLAMERVRMLESAYFQEQAQNAFSTSSSSTTMSNAPAALTAPALVASGSVPASPTLRLQRGGTPAKPPLLVSTGGRSTAMPPPSRPPTGVATAAALTETSKCSSDVISVSALRELCAAHLATSAEVSAREQNKNGGRKSDEAAAAARLLQASAEALLLSGGMTDSAARLATRAAASFGLSLTMMTAPDPA